MHRFAGSCGSGAPVSEGSLLVLLVLANTQLIIEQNSHVTQRLVAGRFLGWRESSWQRRVRHC